MSERRSFEPMGLPWWMALAIAVIVLAGMFTGALSKDLAGAIAAMLVIGIIFNEIGERIPFWNSYIGGGLILAFLASAYLATYGFIPEAYLESMNVVISDVDFLSFFIVFLITGSILSLNRKLMLKSFVGYIPAILGGVFCAAIFGVIAGLFFGVSPIRSILYYVLPIMGGGNGAGAVPLSQIYESVTGDNASNYYAFAITILTIANIFAIISAAVLNAIGDKKSEWTGDHETLMRSGNNLSGDAKEVKPSMADLGGAFLMALSFYALGRLFAKTIFPSLGIHQFAYMIAFVVLAAALGVIPGRLCTACKTLQAFFTKNLILVIMVGVGIDTNLNELIAAITPGNVVMALAIVIGAVLGSAVMGYLVGFYPIDSAVTAGLCMANRGGSGDLAVLGAGKRMGLMAYAQLSSRLGGGIILVIASIMFGMFGK